MIGVTELHQTEFSWRRVCPIGCEAPVGRIWIGEDHKHWICTRCSCPAQVKYCFDGFEVTDDQWQQGIGLVRSMAFLWGEVGEA